MNIGHLFGIAGILCASALTTSCATTDAAGKNPTIKEHADAYKSKDTKEIPNDIKTILMAGGLDVDNPASPTASTKASELIKNPTKSEKEIQALVASLNGQTPLPADAAKPTPTMVASTAPATSAAAKPTEALALVEPEEMIDEESYQFPEIGPNLRPGEAINTEIASIPAKPVAVPEVKKPEEKPLKAVVKKTSRPKPVVVYAKPSVERF